DPPPYSPPPPGPVGYVSSPAGTPPPNKAAAPIALPSGSAPVVRADGAVFIRVGCPPGSPVTCGGFLLIEVPGTAGKSAAKLVLAGRSRYSVRPGRTGRVKVKLNKATRKVLRRKRKLALRITIKPDGAKVVTRYKRTVRLPRRP
ncbi:MAG TPA: hypothetical protein VFY44_07655, partial [Thermoleophilaceae bacterium]|nr:hypothetical protein [Thermoleophilaceae bacterium]